MNQVTSRCIGEEMRGDVALVRSGPAEATDYPETFTKGELAKTANYYRKDHPQQIFAQREKSRFGRKSGFPPGFLDGVPAMHIKG